MISRSEVDRREMIYLASAGDRLKIGVSADLDQRLATLRAKHADIELIQTWRCRYARDAEKFIHRKLMPWRCELGREWFIIPREMAISIIEQAAIQFSRNRYRPA